MEFSGQAIHNPWMRVVIDSSGELRDFVGRSNTGPESADEPMRLQMIHGSLGTILPIYSKSPVSIGQVAAHTASITTEDGRLYQTLVLAGTVDYHGIQAVRLNFDKLKFEQTFKPGAHEVSDFPGYMIIDPSNGVVLKMRSVGGTLETYETSVDMI